MSGTKKAAVATAAAAAAAVATTPAAAQMVRFASIWEQPADNAALDEWYRRTHSREAIKFVGPWLANYMAYRGYDVPAEADRFNTVRYRLTEMWYPNAAARQEAQRAWQPLTPPPNDRERFPNKTRIETMWVPAIPTETWVNASPKEQPSYLRWVFFMRYPRGVSAEDGEAWFTGVHAPQLAKAAGVRRFVCYKSVDAPRDDRAWGRMCELWFDDYGAWRAALLGGGERRFTAPKWGRGYPWAEYASIFTASRPDMDFLNDGYRQP